MPSEATRDILAAAEHLSDSEIGFLQYQYERLINPPTAVAAASEMQSMAEKNPQSGQKVIIVYLMAASHTKEVYMNKGIPLGVFYDTMKSFAAFENNYKSACGVWGFDKPVWALNHLCLNLYRLGRLVFEKAEFPYDYYTGNGKVLKKGDHVLMVHIPANEKLDLDLCRESYNSAAAFSDKYLNFSSKAICCDSWLMYSKLRNILPPQSNIIKFQGEYDIIKETENSQPLKWIFGKTYDNIDDYPISTSLQKGVIEYLRSGGKLGTSFGVRKY